MQKVFNREEFASLYYSLPNSQVAKELHITVAAVKRRAYVHGMHKSHAYISELRRHLGKLGLERRWRYETA